MIQWVGTTVKSEIRGRTGHQGARSRTKGPLMAYMLLGMAQRR